MTKSSAWFTHVAWLLIAITGVVYAWMRYLCEPDDPMALANHPLEPETLALHVISAPLFVFALGLLWRSHILVKIRSSRPDRKVTGYSLLVLAIVCTASGYLLQVSTSELLRTVWTWSHAVTGLALVVVYLLHQFAPHTALRNRRESAASGIEPPARS